MVLGERLKALRKESKLSQAKLGQVLGLSCTAISQYESGTRFPDCDTVVKICKYLNVSSDYLLGITETQASPLKEGSIVVDSNGWTKEQLDTLKLLVRAFRH